ncbi:MOSC domain protein [Aspergillus campestris IBT 28561]|uniref:MOSC domain protein n=1 Tax=Aspergillus campestris (strain IBT 28561) TaxID=1392248 RepID=A0A2I1D3J2_ASPC2|nr:MOSC domain protein [Aspergillus campestris IBT 28561]PKY04445.1 MOSC domain protein [Aspergillus campestris IBT 28561]
MTRSIAIRTPTMQIHQLYTYPIKSLRGIAVPDARLTFTGFEYDRRFMLLKVVDGDDGVETLKNMHVPHFPEMGLFTTDIVFPSGDKKRDGKVIVRYHPPGVDDNNNDDSRVRTLEIPLTPNVKGLEQLDILMHSSPTKGYNMGSAYNDWFSACFGYRVVLAYLGPHSRRVLGSFPPGKSAAHRESAPPLVSTRSLAVLAGVTLALNLVGLSVSSWADALAWPNLAATAGAVLLSSLLGRYVSSRGGKRKEEKITFADVAPYLLVSEASVNDLSGRFQGDVQMDVTKFRPNIVVSGVEKPFEEDFWAELSVGDGPARLLLTANCIRCSSINVDYDTGKMGTGEAGTALKKLMRDRRVDRGAKWNPVFGRYTFLDRGSENMRIRRGDAVTVLRRAAEREICDWPEVGQPVAA